MPKVIGVTEKSGEFNGSPYHNVMINCVRGDENCIGQLSEVIKVKFALVKEIFGRPYSAADWQTLVGKEIRAFFNRYGNCEEIRVVDPVPAK